MPRPKNTKPLRHDRANSSNETVNNVPPASNSSRPSTSRTARNPQRSFSENRTSSRRDHGSRNVPRRSRSEERRPRTQTRLLREIIHLQRTTNLLIPKLPFARLIREVLLSFSHHDLRITSEALMALQESAELYIVQLMEDAYRCTIHRARITLMPKDLQLALYLRQKW